MAATSPDPVATPPANGAVQPDVATSPIDTAAGATETISKGIATAREQAGPLADKAKQFAKERPWTAAALIGSIAVAVLGSFRRGRL